MRRGFCTALVLATACAGSRATPLDAQAEATRRQGLPAEALALYGQALCAAPADLRLALVLVEVWHELGAAGDVRAALGRCALSPTVTTYLDGLVAAVRGQTETADELLARVETLAADGERADVAYRRGLVLLKGKAFERARLSLERAAGLSPARVDVRLALAQAHMERAALADCVAVLRGIMSISPDADQVRRAHRMLQAAVTRNEPPLADDAARTLRDLLAELERGQPNADGLVRLEALVVEHRHPRVLTVAALVALRRGTQTDASRLLEEAASLNPLDPAPWRALGGAYFATDRAGEAVQPLREAFARDPYDLEVATMLAAASAAIGEHATARDTYRALTILAPERADHHLGLARMERRLGRPEAALRAANRGLVLEGGNIPLLVEIASLDAELALEAPTAAERSAARARAEQDVARLQAVAPNHPAARVLIDSLEGG